MRRVASWILLFSASALGVVSCATYAQDLDRARQHYDTNQYERALALFRVLEDDSDSFSPAERAQYAYLRGMTDYRLAGLSPQGVGVKDPRKAFRDNARHWLGLAAAIEKETPGGISVDQKQRLNETLADLNRDVFGGAEALPDEAGAAAPEAAPLEQPGMPPAGPPPPALP